MRIVVQGDDRKTTCFMKSQNRIYAFNTPNPVTRISGRSERILLCINGTEEDCQQSRLIFSMKLVIEYFLRQDLFNKHHDDFTHYAKLCTFRTKNMVASKQNKSSSHQSNHSTVFAAFSFSGLGKRMVVRERRPVYITDT